jgi:acetyl esterase/lipase
MKKETVAFAAMLVAIEAQAASVVTDVPYGQHERQVLDLYLPEGATNPPVVVYIHGGRWFRGDKGQIENYGAVEALTSRGIAIAAINHTYSTESAWPAQIDDVMRALTFVRENGAAHAYDGGRVAVWGQSSGAHLALWAALKDAADPAPDLRAVVAWYAPSDLSNLRSDREVDAVPGGNEEHPEPSPESILIGAPVAGNKAAADAASPAVTFASLPSGRPMPDVLLAHGDMDPVVSPEQSRRLRDILIAQGGASTVELRIVEGAGHGGPLFEPEAIHVGEFLSERFAE